MHLLSGLKTVTSEQPAEGHSHTRQWSEQFLAPAKHADRETLLSLFHCMGKSGDGETEFAVCQFDADIFIFNIKSSVQSSHGSCLLDTGLQLL